MLVLLFFLVDLVCLCISLTCLLPLIFILQSIDLTWRCLKAVIKSLTDELIIENDISGGDLIAAALRSQGVEKLFISLDDDLINVLYACENQGISVIDTRRECIAFSAADGYSRVSGNIGIVIVARSTSSVGSLTANVNMLIAGTPILIICIGSLVHKFNFYNSIKRIKNIVKDDFVYKKFYEIMQMRKIVPIIRTAIKVAKYEDSGPVVVFIPDDFLYTFENIKLFATYRICNKYIVFSRMLQSLSLRLRYGFNKESLNFSPVKIPKCKRVAFSSIRIILNLIAKSRRPLFVVGAQIVADREKISEAFEKMVIPVFAFGMAKGILDKDFLRNLKFSIEYFCDDADLAVIFGSDFNFARSNGCAFLKPIFNKSTKIALISLYKEHSALFNEGAVKIRENPSDFFIALSDHMAKNKYQVSSEWLEFVENKTIQIQETYETLSKKEMGSGDLNPLKVLQDLNVILDQKSIIVSDCSFISKFVFDLLRPPSGPGSWLDAGPCGLGSGYALGAKVACGNANVWLLVTEKEASMLMEDIHSFQDHQLPVNVLIGNNGSKRVVDSNFEDIFTEVNVRRVDLIEYHVIAKSMGCTGILLTNRNSEELQQIFKKAKILNSIGYSVFLDAHIEIKKEMKIFQDKS